MFFRGMRKKSSKISEKIWRLKNKVFIFASAFQKSKFLNRKILIAVIAINVNCAIRNYMNASSLKVLKR